MSECNLNTPLSTMSTTTTSFSLLFFLLLFFSSDGPELTLSSPSRRILHQPFFPVPLDSSPPSQPPSLSPPPTPKYPFSASSPNHSPFLPSDPSSPRPPPSSPPSSSSFTSFPANLSSLNFPHNSPSSSSSKSLSKHLLVVTGSAAVITSVVAAIALFFFFRSRHNNHCYANDEACKTNAPLPPPPPLPQLRKPSSNSSEFLYLGTLVNTAAIDGGSGKRGVHGQGVQRKLQSPELHPLPPLIGRQQHLRHQEEEDQEEFYSPIGSASGRESVWGSHRVFEAVVRAQAEVEAEHLMNNNGESGRGHSDDSTSSSSTSSGSLARSVSTSISPPVSITSPKNRSNPKSLPEFIELQVQPPPPFPEMSFSPAYSLCSSPDQGMEAIKEEDEAEESPLLTNASSSSRMSSPVASPRLSPLTRKMGRLSPEESEWGVLGRTSPSLLNPSTPSWKSLPISSLKLPAFLGGGKRRNSNSSTASNSPFSPHSSPSSISSTASSSRNMRSYPASPLSNASSCFSPRLPNLSDGKSSSASNNSFITPPPPPPPPPAMRSSQSPPPPSVTEPVGASTPQRKVTVEIRAEETPVEAFRSVETVGEGIEETTVRSRLKPLHWDKVRASSDREMVWDHLKSSSFKLNEEMIETLFVVNAPNPSHQKGIPRKHVQPSLIQEIRVLDPKKAQNIAISLRALNVTMVEVCEALLEGNVDTLGMELLESLLKMAPTKEEERRLKEYKDDSPSKLGQAEKFLKAVIDIPFAFKRVEAMLYIANFESEVKYLKRSFEILEAACDELRNSRMFLKLLEAVLKTGNRMNVGTNRGDAHAFKLDTLLKLVDVKGADGKTTLLHFIVQEIIRSEGQCLFTTTKQTPNDEAKCQKLGLQVVSSLNSELTNVKKATAMDSNALNNDVAKLTLGVANIGEVVRLNEQTHLREANRRFAKSMEKFMKMAEEEIIRVQAQESVALSLVKEITEYFHGNSAKEEAHPFRIFLVVRDFLMILDQVCKEVGMINEQTMFSSVHRFPILINPMLPIPVNPLFPQVLPDFHGRRGPIFSEDDSP